MNRHSGEAASERLEAEDLGLPPDARIPLRFVPGHAWSPVVISFPHVGLAWPHDLRPKPQVDFAKNADYAVQTLFGEAAALGAASVEAVYTRLVVDLNRAADDVLPSQVPDHPDPHPRGSPGDPAPLSPADHGTGSSRRRHARGVLWEVAVGGVPILRAPVRYRDLQRRLSRYYEPYYRALELLLARRRQRFGFAVLLDAHSMPSSVASDLVVGVLGGTSCSGPLQRLALCALEGEEQSNGLTVTVDQPYRGGELVRRFGRPNEGLHAFQLEINRSLYMDERTSRLRPHPAPAAPADGGSGSGRAQLPTAPPSPMDGRQRPWARNARRLAELLGRVKCLVRTLARESSHLELAGAHDGVDEVDEEANRPGP